MAYTALYRKLRPQSFDEVIGQEHLITTLKNQIKNNRINHAYLFCGTRGTGKTSTAKIFARAINCEAEDNKPCNKCSVCRNIIEGRSLNVVEIDAASNNGVDNIRDIVEEVKYPPTEGKYKVYIIDEVHMLSTGAFNALLKTLEEPPAHVVFILATTDPQKLPVTILSRCQRFDFHRISRVEMSRELKKDMQNEGVSITDEAIDYVARLSDGAMRDALSILDQCMSFYYGEEITVDKITEITGAVDNEVLFRLTDAISDSDCESCLSIIDEAVLKGRDVLTLASDLVMHFRNLLLAVSVGVDSEALDCSKEYAQRLYDQGIKVSYDYILELIGNFSELCSNMKYSSNQRVLLEVACIKACTPVTSAENGAVEKRLERLEKLLEGGIPMPAKSVPKREEPKPAEPPKVLEQAVPDDINNVIKHWGDFVKSIDSKLLKGLFDQGVKAVYLGGHTLTLVCASKICVAKCEHNRATIEEALAKYFNKKFTFKIMRADEYQTTKAETKPAHKYSSAEEEISNMLPGYHVEITE